MRPDGRLVLVGSTTTDAEFDTRVAAAGLTTAGAPDPSFGVYARSIVDIAGDEGWSGVDVAIGGPGFVALAEVNDVLVTVGFTTKGTLEDSWGEHGIQRNRVSDRLTDVADLAMAGDVRFIAAARTWASPGGALLALKP
jgi:hypothetical protein